MKYTINRAFSSAELVIVLVIVALLVAMAIPAIQRINDQMQLIYVITHRHADGSKTVYESKMVPAKLDSGIQVETVDGKSIFLMGDVTVESQKRGPVERR